MARDIFHQNARAALEKDGWRISDDPYKFEIADIRGEIDLAAEKFITAERGSEKIAVEVKSFLSKSKLADWYEAYGQFSLYRKGLGKVEPGRKLYLAVEAGIFDTFFQKELIREIIEEARMPIIVFDPSKNIIVSWIN